MTIRFNDVEEAELNLLKETFKIQDDSKAVKLAVEWVNNYIKNVTKQFFPNSYDLVLYKKTKNYQRKQKIRGDEDVNLSPTIADLSDKTIF